MKEDCKILIIDDSNTNLFLLKNILEIDGYTNIYTASNGNQGLKMITEILPDLVLLDIMMPKNITGFDVLEMTKKDKLTQNIPIIVISAKIEADNIDKAIDLGAIDYISKPIAIDSVLSKVNSLLLKN